MSDYTTQEVREKVEVVYHSDSRRVLATLIRLLGDFNLAEEALQDAFTAAIEQWPRDGIPTHPAAWLISTGRFTAIDSMRLAPVLMRLSRSLPGGMTGKPSTPRVGMTRASRMTNCGWCLPAAILPFRLKRRWR